MIKINSVFLQKGVTTMKIQTKILTSLIAFCIIFCSAISAEAAKKVVAVMPLENVYGYNTENVAEIMTEEIMIALQNSGKYSVVERDQMATILKEQGFQNIAADPSTAVEIGKLIGADYSLIGKVTLAALEKNPAKGIIETILGNISETTGNEFGFDLKNTAGGFVNGLKGKVSVDIRFVNNETGELVFAKSFNGSKTGATPESALYESCKAAAAEFLKEITSSLMGRVADISGDEIYIDQGSDNGLQVGDELSVVRETSPIEVNGKIVGMKTIPVGKVKVTEVNAEYSICKVVSTEKSKTIQKGDVVKRG
jgi:curli biogenesis system outer membrane secretion channel CsgG